jgi:glycosyltransferase involved in cell wall biosynthesis
MRIVWLCHYFAPEIGAPQARLLELSRVFRDEGHDVAVVTCFPNHPTGVLRDEDRGVSARRDEMDGIAVFRCRSYVAANQGFLKKVLGHLSFMVSGLFGLSRAAREGRPDVVIVSSPTFFSVITAWWWGLWHGVPYVFEVRDLWPAVFVDLGVLKNRVLIRTLEALEMFLYRHARGVVTVTRTFADHIAARGIPRAQLGVVTNGVDERRFRPGPKDDTLARAEDLQGCFVVLYLGAHGISHALARILDAAELLSDLPDVRFVFVGEGAEKAALVERARATAATNVVFHSSVPKDEVALWYGLADAGLVPLRDVPLFDTFIPSKMFELMAAGVPIVASVRGEAREILERSGGALVGDPEDAEAIATSVRALHGDVALRARMAAEGRTFVEAEYTRTRLGRTYLDILRGWIPETQDA